jgi:exonuclease VII large subunit
MDAFRQELRTDMQLQKDMNSINAKQVEDFEQRMQTLQNRVQALTSHDHLSKMKEASTISMMHKQIDEIRSNLGKEIDVRVQDRLQEMVQFAPETTDVEVPLAPLGVSYEQEQKHPPCGSTSRTSTTSSPTNTVPETTPVVPPDSQLPPAVNSVTLRQFQPEDVVEEIDVPMQGVSEEVLTI